MRKILLISFIFLFSCGYQPIFLNKDSEFIISEINFDKNDKISLKINNGLNYLKKSENYLKVIKLELNSEKIINISSKDSKGNPSLFKMTINTQIRVYSKGQIIKQRNISKDFSYKNTSKKFDLRQYEKTIEDNLIETIKEDIILILYN
tara:strand:- start:808 stop:1254 length:447 start_codon:yes stop_codon:yes gene_type:complete